MGTRSAAIASVSYQTIVHVTHIECYADNVLNGGQREDAAEPGRYRPDERPCPTCRGAISAGKLFSRTAFEPTDEELQVDVKPNVVDDDGGVEVAAVSDVKVAKLQRILRKRKAVSRRVLDSDEEDDGGEDDDMSDFIVEDDEDEYEETARRELKKRLKGKRKEIVVKSDDEDDEDIIFGAKPTEKQLAPSQIKLMRKFLPSTKMKVRSLLIPSYAF